MKFLTLVYQVERKVTKIVRATEDNVFEEYEVLYQIQCINLNHKEEAPLVWEVRKIAFKKILLVFVLNFFKDIVLKLL
jgi:hypothetical protein